MGAGAGRRSSQAAGGWGSTGPREYGGRGASPVHVAIFNIEYARARAPQPVNRVGINLAGPTLLAHGTDEQKAPLAAAGSSRPRRSGASSSASPAPGATWPRSRTRAEPVDGGWVTERAEGVDDATPPVAAVGDLPGPHRPGRRPSTVGSRISSSTWKPPASRSGRWCRSRARRSSTRCSSTTCSSRTTISSASSTRDGRSRTRRWPTSGAPTSRSRSRSSTRPTSTSCTTLAAARGALDDAELGRCARPGVRRAARAAPAQLAHLVAARRAARSPGRSRAG